MKYALLVYNPAPRTDAEPEDVRRATDQRVAEILGRPNVTSFLIVRDPQTTVATVRQQGEEVVSLDVPFLEGNDYVGGFILVEADSLEDAAALAVELQETRREGAIEVREVLG